MSKQLPIIVLGGSDNKPGRVPPGLQPDAMLSGYKGAHKLPWGRSLAGELIERLKQCGWFLPPILIGPERIYKGIVDAEIINAEGNLVVSIRTAMNVVRRRFGGQTPIAIIACDVLPTAAELRRILEESYERHQDCMFWWQLIAAEPKQMGDSDWKPSYKMLPEVGGEPVNIYPGHLIIAQPQSLRIGLVSSILELAYRYRNRDVRHRYLPLLVRSFWRLIVEDFRNLFRLQLPILTITLPIRGLLGYRKLRRQKLSLPEFESGLAHLLLHRRYQREAGGRPVVVTLSDTLSLAKDLDTHAEFEEAARDGPCSSAP